MRDLATPKVGVDDLVVAGGVDTLKRLIEDASPADAYVDEMNATHFVVKVGAKNLIATETRDPLSGHLGLTLSTDGELRIGFSNKLVRLGERKVNKLAAWLASDRRREYAGLVFAPHAPGAAPRSADDLGRYFNLFRGYAFAPKAGQCERYLEHIADNICDGNTELFQFFIAWWADLYQHPDRRPGIAIALRGTQGTGKGLAVHQAAAALGQHFKTVANPKHLYGAFNGHTADALLLHADESFWAGDRAAEGVLKNLITEPTRTIEYKGKDAFEIPNHVRLIAASNQNWIVPAGMGERRWCVLDVSDRHAQDHDYFARLVEQMDRGGREALLDYFLQFDLSKVNIRKIPQTAALLEQKIPALPPAELFIYEILRSGVNNGSGDGMTVIAGTEWAQLVPNDQLHRNFSASVRLNNMRLRSSQVELGTALRRLLGVERVRRVNPVTKHQEYVSRFASLAECRARFEQHLGSPVRWDEGDAGATRARAGRGRRSK